MNQLPPDIYNARPEGSISMPLRMEAKKKKKRVGVVLVAVGAPILGLGIFGFIRGGAMMLGVWGTVFGIGLLATGIAVLMKAAKQR